ncbi:sensor-like histidine kinase YfhK [Escherichia coli]|uniref:Sensor-like histidine kinase YfhK n=1 Tax=Escherichia coli TaxID=562 RepID=A0A377HH12_ECOLX|nr:sensor-like histidine kinase YfhK [Escherichia coli]
MVSILDSSSRNLQKLIEQLLDYNRKQADSAVELENVELAPLWRQWFLLIACPHGLK